MIIDKLKNAHQYFNLGERFAKALRYLQSVDNSAVSLGKHEISGHTLYALIQSYPTGERKDCLEAHRRYADIHFMVTGTEVVGIANIDDLTAGTYNEETDYMPMVGDATFIPLREGFFMILYPQDAHMPGVMFDGTETIKKIVVKVLLD